MAPVKVTAGFIDNSREFSKTQFYLPAIAADGSNFAAVLTTPVTSKWEIVRGAIAVASLCNFTDWTAQAYGEVATPTAPTDDYANREAGLWIQYADTVTGKYYSLTIPGPDQALFRQANTDEVDIVANVPAATLKTALDANLVSELGNPIVVTRMRLIGRAS